MTTNITAALSAQWSSNMVAGKEFVGVLEDGNRVHGRLASAKVVFVDAGAIVTAAGEVIGQPVGQPTLAWSMLP